MTMRLRSPLLLGGLAAALALGWGLREAQFAEAQGRRLTNGTVTPDAVPMNEAKWEDKVTGKAGIYLDGATPSVRAMQVGRFELLPGQTPHPPHTHAEEELLIVTRGRGEVEVAGKKTAARAGSVMYVDPNVSHAIVNTGDRPMEFYWIKYLPHSR